MRYDRYNASLTNSINLPPSASQTVDFTSVRAGVIYQPTDVQSYYVSYGTSFNPSLETLTLTNGQQSLDPGNEPASTRSAASGTSLDGNLSLTSAIFQIEKDNTRSQISTGVYELTGNVRVRGFQVERRGPHHAQLAGVRRLHVSSTRDRQGSALDGTQGKVPANTPRNSASLWTTYNLTREWQVGTGVTYMSDRYASNNQRGQGARLLPLGRDGRLSAAAIRRSSSTCSTSPTASTTMR